MKKIILYAGICCVLLGVFAWWHYQPKRVVHRRVLALISTLEVTSESGRTARLMKANRLSGYFTNEVLFDTPFPEVSGAMPRNDLSSGYAFVAENASSIIIKPEDEIEVIVKEKRATVRFHVHAEASIGRWIKPVNGRYLVEMDWEKTSEGWQINKSRWQEEP